MSNIFPEVANKVPRWILFGLTLKVLAIIAGLYYYFTPSYTRAGYQPVQPVSFDHSLHVKQVGLDCRYCHTFVDRSEHSTVPSSNTCMNCHSVVKADSDKLALVRESYQTGESIEWVKIHDTPDYVYFNHAVHVNRGVSCVHCHGQVDEMEEVYHAKSFTMNFCLDCHRNPEEFIRPVDKVYDLQWEPEDPEWEEQAQAFVHDWKVMPPESCSGCHR
ncbi:MAG: cytochrome c family protein [Opitutales bacterium]|nr:cytochrome c family protein [Opitutales bacterium]